MKQLLFLITLSSFFVFQSCKENQKPNNSRDLDLKSIYYSKARNYLNNKDDSTHIYLDSMFSIVDKSRNPEQFAKGLIVRSNAYANQGQRIKNDSIISLMQDVFSKNDIKDLEFYGRFAISNQLRSNEDYLGAKEQLELALKCITPETDEWQNKLIGIYNNSALNAVKLGDQYLAIQYYLQADSILNLIEDQSSRWNVLNNLGSLYRKQKRYNDAEDCFKKSLTFVGNNHYRFGVSSYNLAYVYQNQLKYDSTLLLLKNVLSDTLKIQADTKNLAHALMTSCYIELGDIDKAEKSYANYAASCDSFDISVTLDRRKSLKARILIGQNQPLEARKLLEQEIDTLLKYDPNNYDLLSSLYKYETITYLSDGEKEKGVEKLEKAYESLNNIWEAINAEDIEQWEKRYALAEKNREIESKEQELAYQSARVKNRNILIFLLVVMLGLIAFLLRSYRKNNQLLKINNQIIQEEGEKFKEDNALLVQKLAELEDKLESDDTILDEFLTLPGGKDKVRLKDIIYVKSNDNGMQFITTAGNYFKWGSLTNLLPLLPLKYFKRSSRSFIVNTIHIKAVNTKTIVVSNGDTIKLTDKSKLE